MIKNWGRHPTGLWLPRTFYSPGYPCCCPEPCACSRCDGPYPQSYSITLAGISDDLCSDCTDYNDTFVVECDRRQLGDCAFDFTFDPVPCGRAGGDQLDILVLAFLFDGANRVRVTLDCGPACSAVWRKVWPLTNECEMTAEVLPFAFDTTGECTFTGSTATVTSL